MNKKLSIIGIGKVGSSFAFELKDKNYEIYFLIDRNIEKLEKISSEINPISFSEKIKKEFIEGSDIVLICVQDKYLKDVINEIVETGADISKKYFIHTSGAESTEIFPEEKFDLLYLGSLHPIQTFNKVSYENNHLLENIYFGIEGGKSANELSVKMVKDLKSKYVEIPKDKKYLYHSACVISSNFLITLLNISSEVLGSIGIEKSRTFEIFKPLIENTLINISRDGLIDSLTGPFERNDLEVISKHLNSINKELPSLIPFYTLLGMETVKVAFKKESLDLKNVISILDLMNEYVINEYEKTKKTIN